MGGFELVKSGSCCSESKYFLIKLPEKLNTIISNASEIFSVG
jgi:hypothetical protein